MPGGRSATRGSSQHEATAGYFGPLRSAKYMLLTTFQEDGIPVSSQVHGVVAGDRAYFRAWRQSGTARRLRHTDDVQVTACPMLGLTVGPPLDAVARLLSGEEASRVARKLAGKYPLQQRFLIPLLRRTRGWQLAHYELLTYEAAASQDPASVPGRATLFRAELRLPFDRLPPGATLGGTTEMDENTETAVLAGGCFWIAQELLRHRAGVTSTCVGYTGGENDNPTTSNHPGHAEAVEVIFDPKRTSYRNILEFFFQIHRPDLGEGAVGFDYRSEIFYTTDEQRQVAEDMIGDASGFWGSKVETKISQAGPFWKAEAGDQDYFQHYTDGNNQFSPHRSAAR